MKKVTLLIDSKNKTLDVGCLYEVFGATALSDKGVQCQFVHLDMLDNLPFHGKLSLVLDSDVLIISGFNNEPFRQAQKSLSICANQGGEIHVIENERVFSFVAQSLGGRVKNSIFAVDGGLNLITWGVNLIKLKYGISVGSDVMKGMAVCPADLMQLQNEYEGDLQASSHNFREALIWAEKNLDKVLTVEQVASRACLSRRAFDRKFKELFGTTPKAWLTKLKLEKAKYYLQNSDIEIEKVAVLSGFGSYINLRNCFNKNMGERPSFYRVLNRV